MSDRVLTTVTLRDGREALIEYVSESDAAAMLAYLEQVAGETSFLSFGPGEFGATVEQEAQFIRSLADPLNGVMLKAVVDGELVANAMLTRSQRQRLRHVGELGLS